MDSLRELPLASDETDVELREGCTTDNGPISWGRATDVLDIYRELGGDPNPVVPADDCGPIPFTRQHDNAILDRLKSFRMGFRSENHVAFTYLLTLSAWPIENGEWVPPADHLGGLLSSWKDVRQEIYSVFDSTDWEYTRVLEPTPSGYPRIRLAVLADDTVDDVGTIVDTHVKECDFATTEIHDHDRVVWSARSAKVDEHFSENLSGIGPNRGGDWQTRGFDSLLFATGTDRVEYSSGGADLAGESPVEYYPRMAEA